MRQLHKDEREREREDRKGTDLVYVSLVSVVVTGTVDSDGDSN